MKMVDVALEGENVQLTNFTETEKNGHTPTDHTTVLLDEGSDIDSKPVEPKRARFNIEKVSSPTSNEVNSNNLNVGHEMDTIGYATHEAVPLTMFYRNEASVPGKAKQRPTLAELHKGFDELDEQDGEDINNDLSENEKEDDSKVKLINQQTQKIKFGWVKGVLVPCLLNIWGVILYLRLSWLTGQAGILAVTAIILLSALVTTITALSMSAICTNGEVKGGGAYYLISRSLGPEFGGSIGIIFSLANAVGVALYVIGFGETVQQLMERSNFVLVDKLNDIRIIGLIIIIILLGITLIGLDWVIRAQLFLLLILLLSMFSYVIGTFSGSVLEDNDVLEQQGFTGYKMETFKDNFMPEFREESFFSVFSIFFPAATGILAGVNISGDLKDPQSAIPKGTLAAIALTTVVYIVLAWMIGASAVKDAAGVVSATAAAAASGNTTNAVVNTTVATTRAILNTTMTTTTMTTVVNTTMKATTDGPSCIPNCEFGLLNDKTLMERFSMVGHLVLAGIFAATLSSALASLVGSPKTFQAVCRDGIFKGLGFFGVGSGANDEPRRAYVLTFFISLGFILIGQLDLIAPIISNFFLMSYALINYSVFAASLGKSPGWRPSFRFYNMWLSLFGCFVCIAIMFLINWWAALVTMVIVMALYKYVDYKKPEINWGSSGQAHAYIKALKFAHTLNKTDQHVKNFRPQCLVLAGAPSMRPNLVHFVNYITKHVGLMICGQIVVKAEGMGDTSSLAQEKWLRSKKIKSFVAVTTAPNLRQGAQSLMQCTGLGKLRPNIIVLGFKNNWRLGSEREKVDEYINIIHDSFDGRFSVAILRLPTGSARFDDPDSDDEYDEELDHELEGAFRSHPDLLNDNDAEQRKSVTPANLVEDEITNDDKSNGEMNENTPLRKETETPVEDGSSAAPTPILGKNRSVRRRKTSVDEQKSEAIISMESDVKGVIDVWWMFDDGGLTMLLPYILSRNKQWKGCSLRVLTPVADRKLKSNQVRMASLLKKFRIAFSGIVEVNNLNSRPNQQSIDRFREKLLSDDVGADEPLDKKTLRQIRLGELLREHSHEAKLVVMTMPVPRKSVVSNFLYMSWLDVISEGLDAPMLLVRGNQTSVLTFYS